MASKEIRIRHIAHVIMRVDALRNGIHFISRLSTNFQRDPTTYRIPSVLLGLSNVPSPLRYDRHLSSWTNGGRHGRHNSDHIHDADIYYLFELSIKPDVDSEEDALQLSTCGVSPSSADIKLGFDTCVRQHSQCSAFSHEAEIDCGAPVYTAVLDLLLHSPLFFHRAFQIVKQWHPNRRRLINSNPFFDLRLPNRRSFPTA
jgi:hypothetical protein